MLLLRVGLLGFLAFTTIILGEKRQPFSLKFDQNDYKIKLEWAELVRYDKHEFKKVDFRVFKYNRTCTALNITVLPSTSMGTDLEVIIQAYKFTRDNEYRLFPLRFEVNFCEAMALNLVGLRSTMACGNFTGCPLLKKEKPHHICNWKPNEKKFPPFIPSGRYKMEMQGLYHSKEVWLTNAFLEFYRPFA